MYAVKEGSPDSIYEVVRCTAEGVRALGERVEQSVLRHGIHRRELENGEYGVFAGMDVPRGTMVGMYCGLLSTAAAENKGSLYKSKIRVTHDGKRSILSVDADSMSDALKLMCARTGYSKYINHACPGADNCINVGHTISAGAHALEAIVYETTVDVAAGQQLWYNYGSEYVNLNEKAFQYLGLKAVPCRCPMCMGNRLWIASMVASDETVQVRRPRRRQLLGLKQSRRSQVKAIFQRDERRQHFRKLPSDEEVARILMTLRDPRA